MMPHTYVSFAAGEFLGVVVIEEPDPAAALVLINALGLNPGGEAAFFLVRPGTYPTRRLLSEAELLEIHGGKSFKRRDLTPEEDEELLVHLRGVVCKECNDAAS